MTEEAILKSLESVIDPELRRSIVELDMVRSIDIGANGVVDVTVSLTTAGCPIRGHFQTAVAQAVSAIEGVTHVNVDFDVLTDEQKAALQQKLGRGSAARRGRSRRWPTSSASARARAASASRTLTANLAAALSGEGKRVGVLDADVWGYSIPRMFGLGAQRPPVSAERKILPLEAHGVKVMSIGFFVEEDAAVVWRGPMLHKALTQFLEDVDWGELDYLLIDLPPGTGDVSMTLAQLLAAGAVRDRHHAAAHGAEGRAALGRDGRTRSSLEICRRDREHVRLRHARRASATRSSARAAARSSPTSSTCRCSARCR